MSGLTRRGAEPRDYGFFVRLHAELGVDERVVEAGRWARDFMPATWVAEREGIPVGFLYWQGFQEGAIVRQLVSAPEARKSGVGRFLLESLREELRALGLRRWSLNVKPDNVPALRLYESVGMRLAYESAALRLAWSRLERLPTPPGARSRRVEPGEEAQLESDFGLAPGQLAHARSLVGRELMLVEEEGRKAGVCIFDPAFPGASPFRVKRPALASALLGGLRPLARAEDPSLGIVCENDEALVQWLLEAGASLGLRFLHYRGEF